MCVPPAMVGQVWPLVRHFIEAASRRTRALLMSGIDADLAAQRSLLWVAWDGAAFVAAGVTQLEPGDDGLSCRVVAAGGRSAPDWRALMGGIETFARAEGCRRVRFEGRPGWRRVLPDFTAPRVVYEKELA